MLEVEGVTTTYGGIVAVRNVSLRVPRGRIVALIGGNGAGKTTLLNTICGVCTPREGHIRLNGESLSVRENLELGRLARGRRSGAFETDIAGVFMMFPRLEERAAQIAGSLSGGEQQMLAIGRALMGAPEILLLDEPSLGLAPKVVSQVFEVLQTLNRTGLTILLVEQKARRALEIAHEGYVMERGRVVESGETEALRNDPRVIAHYLGA
jgi:branched-chain amino acid transport system ATP-binding protein